jgi:lactoylglutathione lyase
MKFLGLRTCIDSLSNLEEAKVWYSNILGFPPYFDEPFYVGFNVAGFELGLIPDENQTKEKSTNISPYWGCRKY